MFVFPGMLKKKDRREEVSELRKCIQVIKGMCTSSKEGNEVCFHAPLSSRDVLELDKIKYNKP